MPTEKIISLNNLDRYDKNLKTVAGILQRSTAYALGDVVHNKNIYLKCTTAGTTKATTLDLTSAVKDATITDGTVVWTVTSTTGPASGESSGAGLEDWQASHSYKVDELFVYEGQIYKVLTPFKSGVTFDEVAKINDKTPQEWQPTTAYTEGDIISHEDENGNISYYSVTITFVSETEFDDTNLEPITLYSSYVPQELTSEDITKLVNDFIPSGSGGTTPIFYDDNAVGTIKAYMGITAPKDYLACDGTIYNIADYRELAEHIKTQFGSYNFFGGDGTTTFAVPDLRGEFLRGTGTNGHTNQGSGANVGVHQDSTEISNGATNGGAIELWRADSAGLIKNVDSVLNNGTALIYGEFYYETTSKAGNATIRPTNTSVLYCIKYKQSVLSTSENNYSTEEQRIGTWIDGKPLYQKTVTKSNITLVQNTSISHNIEAVDKIFIKTAFLLGGTINNGAVMFPLMWTDSYLGVYVDDTNITFKGTGSWGNDTSRIVYITLQYTKTTD